MELLLANTDFEFELDSQKVIPLEKSMALGNLTLQLHFIPVLYAGPEDNILVYGLPEKNYEEYLLKLGLWRDKELLPKFTRIGALKIAPGSKIRTWGASKRIQQWAIEHEIAYAMPPWQTVIEVNSKAFSFEHCPRLPDAALLSSEEEVRAWLHLYWPKKVLKTCFGLASRGHFMIDTEREINQKALKSFLQTEFVKPLPVIGEPWVERLMDFSTQWEVGTDKIIRYLGTTCIMNSSTGRYMGTIAGEEKKIMGKYLPFLEEHQQAAEKLLKVTAEKGYFGFAGVDAMIYCMPESGEKAFLHPIVELNARMTMGLAALLFQQRHFPKNVISIHYCSKEELLSEHRTYALLPEAIWKENIKKSFAKQLFFQIHEDS
jgi:hypothetical protein